MKFYFVVSILTLCSVTAFAKEGNSRKLSQADAPKCVFVGPNGGNTPFKLVDGDSRDKEYHTMEKFTEGDLVFKYMEGHGQARLEAYRKGKFVAATFSSRNIELNLDVGKVEAGCYGINGGQAE